MKFPKEAIVEALIWGDNYEYEGVDMIYISNEMIGTSRWEIQHELIFEYDDQFYAYYYSVGATEMQDHRSYDDEGDMIEVRRVKRFEVITYEYKPIDEPKAKTGPVMAPPVPLKEVYIMGADGRDHFYGLTEDKD